jgi:hypothetical protein
VGNIIAVNDLVGGVFLFMRRNSMENKAFGDDMCDIVEPATEHWSQEGLDRLNQVEAVEQREHRFPVPDNPGDLEPALSEPSRAGDEN